MKNRHTKTIIRIVVSAFATEGFYMPIDDPLDLPSPWSDWNIKSLAEWPESTSEKPELLDESFGQLNSVLQGFGSQLFVNMIGRDDVQLCNICGIMFFPENPAVQCPLCSLLRWLIDKRPRLRTKAGGALKLGSDLSDFNSLLDSDVSNAELLKQLENSIIAK